MKLLLIKVRLERRNFVVRNYWGFILFMILNVNRNGLLVIFLFFFVVINFGGCGIEVVFGVIVWKKIKLKWNFKVKKFI